MGRALFYSGSWYAFDNFSSFRVYWWGVDWMTSEHAYQAAKFSSTRYLDISEEIRNARSAHDAKKIAQKFSDHVRPDWERVKLSFMEDILRAKLDQHAYIQRKLLETGDLEIVEDSPKDSFWGRGSDWQGQNNLGKIWMKLREELRKKPG